LEIPDGFAEIITSAFIGRTNDVLDCVTKMKVELFVFDEVDDLNPSFSVADWIVNMGVELRFTLERGEIA